MTSDIIASTSAGAAIVSLVLSAIALWQAGRASNINIQTFKRQGVIDLHMAWHGITSVVPGALIAPDVIRGVNALSLTASLWNHDVIEKEILYQSYWASFKEIYETLNGCSEVVPGTAKRCRECLTREITRAYDDMKKRESQEVTQTMIG